jgi:polyisoprenoid-binding protein YceI
MRIAIAVAAVTSIALISVLAVVLLRDSGSEPGTAPPPSSSATPSASTSPTPTASEPSPTPTTATRTPSPTVRPFAYQPLWPFSSDAAAAEWQRSYRANGHQPWHLDAEQTALSFTSGYLGFTEVNRVVSSSISGGQARIGVGYQAESRASLAAMLHLVKLGRGQDAPWEVVGTIDTTFTLDRPRYGAQVTSPLTVGGRITGVDESIRVDVRQPSSTQPIGTSCCVPAGGERQPWSARVTFTGATDPALTIAVSTGGHLQGVERFAITGVRPAPAS